MFMAPVEGGREWETKSVVSGQRFLERLWRFVTQGNPHGHRPVIDEMDEGVAVRRAINVAIQEVTEDCENLRLNTAIAKLMKCLNEIFNQAVSLTTLRKLVLIVAPFAPFVAEELWQRLGGQGSLAYEQWPAIDHEAINTIQHVQVPIMINGKKRSLLEEVDPTASDASLKQRAAEKLGATQWMIGEEDTFLIIRDAEQGFPKIINIVQRGQ
jgi:leucyl-tRNA synthetase